MPRWHIGETKLQRYDSQMSVRIICMPFKKCIRAVNWLFLLMSSFIFQNWTVKFIEYKRYIYIKKVFPPHGKLPTGFELSKSFGKKKTGTFSYCNLGCKRNFMLQVCKIKLFSIHAETFRILALRQFQNCLRRKNVWFFRRFSRFSVMMTSNLR